MSADYSIAAIPTTYRGIKYRSRLEARWAAFFDQLGWHHDYEPYDLGVWSPDFIVRAKNCEVSVLVEVKPIQTCCEDTIRRMSQACAERGIFRDEDSVEVIGAVLLGVSPRLTKANSNHYRDQISLGWYIPATNYKRARAGYEEVGIGWQAEFDLPEMRADILMMDCEGRWWLTVMGGDADTWHKWERPAVKAYAAYTMNLWAEACNLVQWHKE